VKALKMLMKSSGTPKVEVPMYEGELNVEELMDWINAMNTYFDFEDVEEDTRVKYEETRLKGHATLWWDEVQYDRKRKGKSKIKSWDKSKISP
jgi:hypothetical protein